MASDLDISGRDSDRRRFLAGLVGLRIPKAQVLTAVIAGSAVVILSQVPDVISSTPTFPVDELLMDPSAAAKPCTAKGREVSPEARAASVSNGAEVSQEILEAMFLELATF